MTIADKATENEVWGPQRSRTVTWHEPGPGVARGLAIAGIDYLKAHASRAAPAESVRLRRRNPDHWAKTLKPCLVCGRQVALASWGKYCSSACSSKAAYARRKKTAILTLAEGRIEYTVASNAALAVA